jgi:hypothetical protein
MLCYNLKTLDKLKEAKEKEKQIKTEHIATKAAAMPSNTLLHSVTVSQLLFPEGFGRCF